MQSIFQNELRTKRWWTTQNITMSGVWSKTRRSSLYSCVKVFRMQSTLCMCVWLHTYKSLSSSFSSHTLRCPKNTLHAVESSIAFHKKSVIYFSEHFLYCREATRMQGFLAPFRIYLQTNIISCALLSINCCLVFYPPPFFFLACWSAFSLWNMVKAISSVSIILFLLLHAFKFSENIN